MADMNIDERLPTHVPKVSPQLLTTQANNSRIIVPANTDIVISEQSTNTNNFTSEQP